MKTIGRIIWIQGPFNWFFISNGMFLLRSESMNFLGPVAAFIKFVAFMLNGLNADKRYTFRPWLLPNLRLSKTIHHIAHPAPLKRQAHLSWYSPCHLNASALASFKYTINPFLRQEMREKMVVTGSYWVIWTRPAQQWIFDRCVLLWLW